MGKNEIGEGGFGLTFDVHRSLLGHIVFKHQVSGQNVVLAIQ